MRLVRVLLPLLVCASLLAACGMGGGGSGTGGPGPGPGPGPSTADQQYNLDRVNYYRGLVGAPPLVLDTQLNSFAQDGSVQLSQDHTPHQHFNDAAADGTLFTTDGFSGSAAENQGDPNGWFPAGGVQNQIDQILQMMWNEGPGSGSAHGHYNNMANPSLQRLGVGLLVDGNGRLYFTNDFSQ